MPGWFCPPLLFPGIPFTLQLQTSLKIFKWSCRLWPHISGHISPEAEEAPGIVDVYPNVTYWRAIGLAPIFPDTFYRLTHYWFAAADIPVANDIPVHCADAIRCNVRRPPQGSLPLLTRQVLA